MEDWGKKILRAFHNVGIRLRYWNKRSINYPVAVSDDIEMTFDGDVPEKVIAVHNIEEERVVVTKAVVVNKDVVIVIKTEEVEEDLLKDSLTEEDYEPFVLKTVVKTFSDDYLSSLLKGNIQLSEFNHGMKDQIILALCMKLAMNKTTLERAAYIHQLRN